MFCISTSGGVIPGGLIGAIGNGSGAGGGRGDGAGAGTGFGGGKIDETLTQDQML